MGGSGSGWQGAKKALVEECLILTIDALALRGALALGWKRGSLGWRSSRRTDGFAELEYSTVISADGTGGLWLRYKAKGERVYDCISLLATVLPYGGRRWWFKCPIQNIRAAKLYLPPAAIHFASRQAHKLTYRSCQESGKFERDQRRLARLLGATS